MDGAEQISAARGGGVRQGVLRSRILGRDWRYVVYAPPGFSANAMRCPALYLLHGNYGGPSDFVELGGLRQTADALIAAGRMPPAIIAMPDGGDSWYVNHGATRMEDAIIDEFIPFIERNEGALAAREARLIGGISMGGYGALRLALKHPDLFSAAALMSPAAYADAPHAASSARCGPPFCAPAPDGRLVFDPQAWRRRAYPSFIDAGCAAKPPVRFHIDSGDQDEFGIAIEAARLYRALRAHGQPARFGLRDGGHDWPTWTRSIAHALSYVFNACPPQT